jgi:FdhD protein
VISVLKINILRVDASARTAQKKADYVAEERPLHVFLNKTRYVTIFCSPSNLKELAVGHAVTGGIVESIEEIEGISLKEKEGMCRINLKPQVKLEDRIKLSEHFSRVIFSACGEKTPYQPTLGIRKVQSGFEARAGTILTCVNRLNFVAETFRRTGGVHVAAIYEGDGTLMTFAEDVGRHNAVDKVIGTCALRRIEVGKCFLTLSGRLTGDVVQKAARVGLPIIASMAAAIDSGIRIAMDAGVTLVGFARGKHMNVYTFPERILLDKSMFTT